MVLQASSGSKVQHGAPVKAVSRGPAPTAARGGKGWGKGAPSSVAAVGQVAQLREMGFTDEVAKRALAECVWDVNQALDLLFTRGAEAFTSDTSEKPTMGFSSSSNKGHASDQLSLDREDVGEVSTTASTASSPRSANKVDVQSPPPSQESRAPQESCASLADCPLQDSCLGGEGLIEQVAGVTNVSGAMTVGAVDVLEVAGVADAELTACLRQEQVVPLPSIKEVVDLQGTRDVVTKDDSISVEDAGVIFPRRKRVERVNASWTGEDTALTVSLNEFVLVWVDSTTEHGWIYAEHVSDTSRVGWLPTFIFEVLPQHYSWMMATSSSEAVHETQLEVREEGVFKVNRHTRTEQGWVYAETACVGNDHSSDGAGTAQSGWVPVFCLEWTEE